MSLDLAGRITRAWFAVHEPMKSTPIGGGKTTAMRASRTTARLAALVLGLAISTASAGCATTAADRPAAAPSPTAGHGVQGRSIGGPAAADAHATASAVRLRGYLALSYGRRRARDIEAITPQLRAQLERNAARMPLAQRARHPRIVDLRLTTVDPHTINARATIHDGGVAPYPLFLTLTRTRTGWLVRSLGD